MKKRLLLSAVLFVCSFQSFSQDTLANMLEVGNTWYRTEMEGFRIPNTLISEEILNDTIISDKKYSKVQTLSTVFGNINQINKTINFIRQEKNTLYAFDLSTDSESLLYRFTGLKVGDSLINNKNYYRFNYEITFIDTLIFSNTKLRRFLLKTSEISTDSDSEVWYFEGVGSEGAGLFFAPYYFFEGTTQLICSRNKYGNFYLKEIFTSSNQNNTFTLEENKANSTCNPLVLKTFDNTLTAQITLSKHSENLLQFNTELSLSNAQISTHDMKGSKYNCSIQQNNLVDIAALPAGLYILKIQTTDQNWASFKFIK